MDLIPILFLEHASKCVILYKKGMSNRRKTYSLAENKTEKTKRNGSKATKKPRQAKERQKRNSYIGKLYSWLLSRVAWVWHGKCLSALAPSNIHNFAS